MPRTNRNTLKGIQFRFSAWSNTFARFFSVSPIYLETIMERSIRYTSIPFFLPIKVAQSVLPVPGGPCNFATDLVYLLFIGFSSIFAIKCGNRPSKNDSIPSPKG